MSKSKKPAAENAVLTQATNKGRVDTQTQHDATRLYKDN